MSKEASDYQWSDAWFLLAVSYVARDGNAAKLSDVIGASDYINHAILTVAEIKSAMYKLTRDDWITYKSGAYLQTERMKNEFSKLPAKSEMSQMTIVESWLGATEYSGDYDPNVLTAPDFEDITEEMVDQAAAEYKSKGKMSV